MFFKKKEKRVTWKKEGELFFVFINNKIIKCDIQNCWIGDDLLVIVEKLQKYYLLQDYADSQKDIIFEAEFVAETSAILWSKLDEGYFLYENCETVNDESNPFYIKDIMMVSYKGNAYLLKDYDDTADNILKEAILISESEQVHWMKADEHFYILNGGKLLDINHTANFSVDDLTIYIDELEALFVLYNYKNRDDYTFYEAWRMAEKNEYLWRKTAKGSFNLFVNQQSLHSNSVSTFHNDDVVAFVPELGISLLLSDMRNTDTDDYFEAEVISTTETAFWSAFDKNYYLIDKGENISCRVGDHNSLIGNDLLVYDPESSTTYFLQNYLNLKDEQLRPALILSRSAKAVWSGNSNSYSIWYEGKRTGECEHQYLGDDLMVMPKATQIMLNLANFRNRQDNRLRAIE